MPRSERGRKIHSMLVEEAAELLARDGYEVKRGVRAGDSVVDVVGYKGGVRVAVECIVRVSEVYVYSRIAKLSQLFDRVVFLAPKGSRIVSVPEPHSFIISESVEYSGTVTVKVSWDTYRRLNTYRAKLILYSGGVRDYTIDEVIAAMLDLIEYARITIPRARKPRVQSVQTGGVA